MCVPYKQKCKICKLFFIPKHALQEMCVECKGKKISAEMDGIEAEVLLR